MPSPLGAPIRLATWNCCAGPLDRKLAAAAELRADVIVIPESPALPRTDRHHFWTGDTPRKGLAVLTSARYTLRRVPRRHPLPKFVIPLMVEGPVSFLLLAVWMKGIGPDRYVRGMHRALTECRALMRRHPTVVLGDLNSNAIWDHEHPADRNHSALVTELAARGLVSTYHQARGEAHGEESEPTFYFYRRKSIPYHLDYCFIPAAWSSRLKKVEVGTWRDWHALSDHVPVVADLR